MSKTEKPDNIRPLRAPRREISYRHQLGLQILRYDETTLEIEWRLKDQHRIARHDLLLLSPLFMEDSTQADDALESLRKAFMWLAGAAVIFFSEFNTQIPLLAPVLGLVGGRWLLSAGLALRAHGARTVICESSGEIIVDIPHRRTEENHRLGFEAGLRKAIEAMHKQWRDGEI